MEIEVDVLIVGSGFTGLFAADEAISRGYSCVIVSESKLGKGQSLHMHGNINTLQY
jgi:succinate dehydrogenase/fumarate reductase flavoprotein subunit